MIAAAQAANLGKLQRNEAPDQPRAFGMWATMLGHQAYSSVAQTEDAMAAQRSYGSNLFREKKEGSDLANALRELLFWAPGRTGLTGRT